MVLPNQGRFSPWPPSCGYACSAYHASDIMPPIMHKMPKCHKILQSHVNTVTMATTNQTQLLHVSCGYSDVTLTTLNNSPNLVTKIKPENKTKQNAQLSIDSGTLR